jgi:hypothetical protein
MIFTITREKKRAVNRETEASQKWQAVGTCSRRVFLYYRIPADRHQIGREGN